MKYKIPKGKVKEKEKHYSIEAENKRKIDNKSRRVFYEYDIIDKKTKTICAVGILATSKEELKKRYKLDERVYKLIKTGKYNARKDIYFNNTSTFNPALGGIVTQSAPVIGVV